MISINPGENAIIRRSLKYSNGTSNIPLSSLVSLVVKLRSSNFYKEYTYPETNLRIGPGGSNQYELEIVESESSLFPFGKIQLETEIRKVNPYFVTDIEIFDIIKEKSVIIVTGEPTSGTHVDTSSITSAIDVETWLFDSTIADFSSTRITWDQV